MVQSVLSKSSRRERERIRDRQSPFGCFFGKFFQELYVFLCFLSGRLPIIEVVFCVVFCVFCEGGDRG